MLIEIDAEHPVDQVWHLAAANPRTHFQEYQATVLAHEQLQVERGVAQPQRLQALATEVGDARTQR
ncbi:hypothetical protein D3C80_2045390 [compost metagenome]